MRLVVMFAFCAAAFGQDRVFVFQQTSVPEQMNEIATVIGGIADIPDRAVDTAAKELTLRAPANQMEVAAWLFPLLDRPANQDAAASSGSPGVEFKMTGAPDPDNIVHVFYLSPAQTPQELQQLATAVRSTTEIRRMFVYQTPRILVTRGTADQTAVAQWMFAQLTKPKTTAPQTFPGAASGDVYGVFHLSTPQTLQDFQEVATVVRSIGEIRRLFTYNDQNAISMRGTPDQAALAQFLVKELDKPSHAAASDEYHTAEAGDNIVQVFYVPNAGSVSALQQLAREVRTKAGIRRLFTYNAPRAIAVRGSEAQVHEVAQLIAEAK